MARVGIGRIPVQPRRQRRGNTGDTMQKVFIYWDNSNIYHEAQRLTRELDPSAGAYHRVRIHCENLYELARAERDVEMAFAAGSVPPKMQQLWNRMENQGMKVKLYDRRAREYSEQEMPDIILQKQMLEDALDYNGVPGIVVLLTGDGAGYYEGSGFHRTLERMHKRGWQVEILSWRHACNRRMREWAEANGKFIALDDFYYSLTFTNPSGEGYEFARARDAEPIDLSKRDRF